MNKIALLALADHMDRLKPQQYNQGLWFDGKVTSRQAEFALARPEGPWDRALYSVRPKEGFCGSSACVLGHAPSVKETGLFLTINEDELQSRNGRRYFDEDASPDVSILDEDGELLSGIEAGAFAFGIPRDHAKVMFNSQDSRNTRAWWKGIPLDDEDYGHDFDYEVTPQQVAARLREYVATDGKVIEPYL